MKRIRKEDWVPLAPALPLATPFVVNVDPSSACNFKCRFCFQSGSGVFKKGIMDFKLYQKVIADMRCFEKKVKTLRLYAFGEPLLNPHFADMVKEAKDNDVAEFIDTTTNGSQFHPVLNADIIAAGIDRINISVIGVSSEQYRNFSRANVDFLRYVENIAHLFSIRGKCKIFIKINGDAIPKHDQEEFLEIFSPISDGIAIEHVMDCWYDFGMKDIKKNLDVGVYGNPLTHVKVCPYIFYSFCVNYDGVVSACFLDWNRKLVVGDLRRESLRQIWNGFAMNEMRRIMLKKERGDHSWPCKNCNQLEAGEPVNLDDVADEILERL